MHFAIFPFHLSKVLRLPWKSEARSYEVLHLSRKTILANPKIWCSKMQPLSGNQRPDLLTSLKNMSLALRLPRKMDLCRSSQNAPRLPTLLKLLQNHHVLLTFDRVHNPCLPRETKSGPNMWCFLHFDLETCFAPQQRALFQHPNFENWSETVSFLTLLTSTCASRHSGVQFFISRLARWLRARHFSEPTFGKNTVNRDFFYLFAHLHLLSSDSFSSLIFFFFLLFSSLTLPHLCFSIGSLTSKLPSIITVMNICIYNDICYIYK